MVPNSPIVLAGIDGSEVVVLALIISGVVSWVFIHNFRKAFEARQREQTRREIAAYVAEGSIKPEDAATILNAGTNESEAIIADGVAWGTIKPEKAERLIRSMKQGQGSAAAQM